MNKCVIFIITLYLLCFETPVFAQINETTGAPNLKTTIAPSPRGKIQRCYTVEYYNRLFSEIPGFKTKFEANQKRISPLQQLNVLKTAGVADTLTIAVHIVGNATIQSEVTDAAIQSQIDVLNKDYNANNADSARIPASFKPLFGKMGTVFMLAQTDPNGFPTTGIDRRSNNITFDHTNFDDAKSYAKGGLDAWDPGQYINIWVIDFGITGLLGISVFPGDPRPLNLHGVVCDYRGFGTAGAYLYPQYAQGRTVSHELGHFFNLRHTWGDDGGDCTGIDFPDAPTGQDDTPNQGDHTFGDPDLSGTGTVVTDGCSPSAPGIMYQNYMDYTDDVDLVMFTRGQVDRMQTALTTSPDRSPLLNSKAFRPPFIYTYDARMRTIASPITGSSVCSNDFSPKVVVRNQGSFMLTTVNVSTVINNGTAVTETYSVNLAYGTETTLTLPSVSGVKGINTLKIFTSQPSGNADQNVYNDTSITTFKIVPVLPLTSFSENFTTSNIFPPKNWNIRNPDNDMTWEWNSTMGAKAAGSAWFNDFNNPTNDRFDDLVMPDFSYQNIDSIFLKFSVANAMYSDPSSVQVPLDTLTILISKDCGNTFIPIYKKWGAELQTAFHPPAAVTGDFFPNSFQWRRDSLNLGQWLSTSEPLFQVTFRFSGNYENNIFLDDIDLNTEVLPARLKSQGYLILPTVFQSRFTVWHYQQPVDLKYINVFNSTGQLMWSRQFSGNADKFINIDLSNQSSGVYFVNLGYNDSKKNLTQKVVKK
ncbi:MAG: zinc-dependent metalloprotease [Flavisolibacter sp.]